MAVLRIFIVPLAWFSYVVIASYIAGNVWFVSFLNLHHLRWPWLLSLLWPYITFNLWFMPKLIPIQARLYEVVYGAGIIIGRTARAYRDAGHSLALVRAQRRQTLIAVRQIADQWEAGSATPEQLTVDERHNARGDGWPDREELAALMKEEARLLEEREQARGALVDMGFGTIFGNTG